MISIVSVNYNCLDFVKLLVQSVRQFTSVPHEIIIVDNASVDGSQDWLREQRDVETLYNPVNMRHGPSLDQAIREATMPYVLVLDIDAHVMRSSWDRDVIRIYESLPDTKLIAAKGGDPDAVLAKPIHACMQFFERGFFIQHSLSFAPRDGHDVGRKNYYDVKALGYDVLRVFPGFEEGHTKFYGDVWGDTYYLGGKPTFYHNWYSARIWHVESEIDKYRKSDIEAKIKNLFENRKIKAILGA